MLINEIKRMKLEMDSDMSEHVLKVVEKSCIEINEDTYKQIKSVFRVNHKYSESRIREVFIKKIVNLVYGLNTDKDYIVFVVESMFLGGDKECLMSIQEDIVNNRDLNKIIILDSNKGMEKLFSDKGYPSLILVLCDRNLDKNGRANKAIKFGKTKGIKIQEVDKDTDYKKYLKL